MASKRFSVDAVFRGINKISKPVRSMGRSISKFAKNSNRKIAKLGKSFLKLGVFMSKALIGGAGLAAAAMGAAVVKTAELGDEAAKTSRRLGLSAEALQELRFAADRQGVSSGLLNSSFTALQKRVGELKSGTGSLFAFLKKTGDKAFIRQLKLAKNTEEAFELVTKKAATIEDPMKKAAFAAAAFSRSGIDMLKFMEAGTDGIAQLRGEARKYGAVISNDAAAKSELFIDAMTNFKSVIAGVGLTLGSKLMPFLTKIIQGFADFWAQNRKIISQGIDKFIAFIAKAVKMATPFIKMFFGAIRQVWSMLKELAPIGMKAFQFIQWAMPFLKPFIATLLVFKGVLIAIALVTKGWAIAQGILNTVLALNPIGLVVIAVAALVAGIVLLIQNWDTIVAAFKSGIQSIWTWFSDLLDNPFFAALSTIFLPFITVPALIFKHWEPIKEFFSSIWDIFTNGFNNAMEAVTKIISTIQSIPGVKSVIDFFTGGDSEADAKPVTREERLSRMIEEKKSESTLTIKDQTGRAELSQPRGRGPQIALETSGAL